MGRQPRVHRDRRFPRRHGSILRFRAPSTPPPASAWPGKPEGVQGPLLSPKCRPARTLDYLETSSFLGQQSGRGERQTITSRQRCSAGPSEEEDQGCDGRRRARVLLWLAGGGSLLLLVGRGVCGPGANALDRALSGVDLRLEASGGLAECCRSHHHFPGFDRDPYCCPCQEGVACLGWRFFTKKESRGKGPILCTVSRSLFVVGLHGLTIANVTASLLPFFVLFGCFRIPTPGQKVATEHQIVFRPALPFPAACELANAPLLASNTIIETSHSHPISSYERSVDQSARKLTEGRAATEGRLRLFWMFLNI